LATFILVLKGFELRNNPKILEKLKCEFKMKIVKEEGIGVPSLVHNTLEVKKACWSFGMGTRMNEKWVNYSYEPAQTRQQVG
jgi:hypothetical protein